MHEPRVVGFFAGQPGLAPMEGVTEWPLRLWMMFVSQPAFLCTPFLRVTPSFPQQVPEDFLPEYQIENFPKYPVIPQLMAASPDDFVRTARQVLTVSPFVDLNCGCPSPNPVSGGAGSSLLRNTTSFILFLSKICENLPDQKLSVKMRIGFDHAEEFPAMIEGLKHLPLHHLTIHGRTRKDRYDGSSQWSYIDYAASRLPYPVIASGDLVNHQAYQKYHQAFPHIKASMIGRGALRNPWIFSSIRTQSDLTLDRLTLQYALAVYTLLTELSLQHSMQKITQHLKDDIWHLQAGQELEKWRTIYEYLCQVAFSQRIKLQELVVNRISLGRLKMLWNSLRSSLPSSFHNPAIMRCHSLGEWLAFLEEMHPATQAFTIKHHPEWDWLYTSSRKREDVHKQ